MEHAKLFAAVCGALALLSAAALGGCAAGGNDEATATTAAPVTTQEETTTTFATLHGSLTASELIVRSGPGFTYDSVGGMARGEEFTIVGREGDWYRVIFGDDYGYVNAAYVDVEGQPNASEMAASFTTVSRATTTSRTNPQGATTTTAGTTDAAGTTATGETAAATSSTAPA